MIIMQLFVWGKDVIFISTLRFIHVVKTFSK